MHITPESETSPQRVAHYTARQVQVPNRSPLPKVPRTNASSSKALDVKSPVPNIIVFGETGVGKSSIINMLQGEEAATTSNSAYGCTLESSYHEVTLASPASGEKKYRLWDTSGLNEGDKGTVPAQKAIANIVTLVRQLRSESSSGGVSLLVYCIRGARLREIIRVNYDLFWGIICNGQVPIVLVITGLENEDDMDGWWRENRAELEDVMRMKFDGHACVTSTKGKLNKSGYVFEEEYQESVGKLRMLLASTCALYPGPLRIEGERWMVDIQMRLKHYMSEYNQRTGQERRVVEGCHNTIQPQSQDSGPHVSQGSGQERVSATEGSRSQEHGWVRFLAELLAAFFNLRSRQASDVAPASNHRSFSGTTPPTHQQVRAAVSNVVPGGIAPIRKPSQVRQSPASVQASCNLET